jgi:cell wall assembly regulator SMI1
MSRTIDAYQRLRTAYRALAPEAGAGLYLPLSDARLARLRGNVSIPNEIADLLSVHDGQRDRTLRAIPEYNRILSAEEIGRIYVDALSMANEENASHPDGYYGFWGTTQQFEPLVKWDRYWRAGWVPFAQFERNIWFIDQDPGPEGVVGQVVYSEVGIDPPLGVLAKDLPSLFERMLAELEAGRHQDDGCGGRVVSLTALTPVELLSAVGDGKAGVAEPGAAADGGA